MLDAEDFCLLLADRRDPTRTAACPDHCVVGDHALVEAALIALDSVADLLD